MYVINWCFGKVFNYLTFFYRLSFVKAEWELTIIYTHYLAHIEEKRIAQHFKVTMEILKWSDKF